MNETVLAEVAAGLRNLQRMVDGLTAHTENIRFDDLRVGDTVRWTGRDWESVVSIDCEPFDDAVVIRFDNGDQVHAPLTSWCEVKIPRPDPLPVDPFSQAVEDLCKTVEYVCAELESGTSPLQLSTILKLLRAAVADVNEAGF